MSLTTLMTEISLSTVPRIAIQLDFQAAGGSSQTGADRRKIYIAGPRNSADSDAAANEVRTTPFADANESKSWFGTDSGGAYMAAQAFKQRPGGNLAKIYGAAYDPPAGSSASQTFTFATNASSTGTFRPNVMGHAFAVGIESGDTPTEAGDTMVAAFNLLPDDNRPPATIANAAGTVTVTAKLAGLEYNTAPTQDLTDPSLKPTDMTLAVGGATMTGGTLEATLTTLLANMLAVETPQLVTCYDGDSGAVSILLFKAHIIDKSNAENMRSSNLIFAGQDTVANLVSHADAADSNDAERLRMPGINGSGSWPVMIAAQFAAALASEPDVARPLNGIAMPNIIAPSAADRFTRTEQDSCHEGGVTALVAPDDQTVRIVRAIVVRMDIALPLDITVIDTMDLLRAKLDANFLAKFPRFKVVPNGSETFDRTTTTPAGVLDEAYATCKDMERDGQLTNVDALWGEADSELVTGGRVNLLLPATVVPGLHIIAALAKHQPAV